MTADDRQIGINGTSKLEANAHEAKEIMNRLKSVPTCTS